MNKKLKEKIRESLSSVVPITVIVFLLSVSITPISTGATIMFLVGAVMLIVGMGFFSLGADTAMMPMGEALGAQIAQTSKTWLVVIAAFVIGIAITIAEPDLQILAGQVPAIPDAVLILTVGVGVGVFLVVAMLRVLFKVRLPVLLLVFYIGLFILAEFAPGDFISVAFDSGGVTTGPITVPFIIALGVGLSSLHEDASSQEDSFGLVALCSIGPIIAVLLLGIGYNPSESGYTSLEEVAVITTQDVAIQFARHLPEYAKEVILALAPICLFMLVFQLVTRKFSKRRLATMMIGFVYTLIGLTLFLTGVNVGFIPAGHLIGAELAMSEYSWLLIPVGMVIGYYIVVAEPAVHVLNKQVEEISRGAIPQKVLMRALSVGVAISLAFAMLRVLTGISLSWIVLPGYAIAITLTFFTPGIFIGIGFDSGGVASGVMTSTFVLPFAIGACETLGGNVLTDAFGVVALIAMTPLITIQLVGLIYAGNMKIAERRVAIIADDSDGVVEF
ncbi:membrane protein [Synergistales bacterium]|nr:membrane protein [Synergistales bacterium]